MHDPLGKKVGASFLLLLTLATAQIPLCLCVGSLTVSLYSPTNGATLTSGPVTLAVVYTNSSDGSHVVGVYTEFYMQMPSSSFFETVGNAFSGSDGHASLTFNPPFAGSYQWYVKGYAWENVTSSTWTFICAILTTTLTRWTTTTYTQTVGLVTEYSYLYETVTRATTAYKTQTVSTTRITNLRTTMTRTSTAFATTETTPVTCYQTESTTRTEKLYATVSVTQYVYIDSYSPGQVIEYVTIQQISTGSEGFAHFSKGDKHKIQTIAIDVISSASNVTITIGTAPDRPIVGTRVKEYGFLEISTTNLSDENIKSVLIEFKVDRNWLSNSQIRQDRVNLYRYEGGEWRRLQTSLLRTDETYAYYQSVSPGLSIFAIAGQSSSFFEMPEIGPIWDSYALILSIIVVAILGAYGGIRITNARLKRRRRENGLESASVETVGTSAEDQIDRSLLEYIARHGGSISLSKAAEELGVPVSAIKETISRLRDGGRLTPV